MSDAFERLRDRYWELEERLKAVEARAAEAEQLHEESERRRVVSFNRAEEAERVLREIANWGGNGDYTLVLRRMALRALAATKPQNLNKAEPDSPAYRKRKEALRRTNREAGADCCSGFVPE
jgi:hypothetical protein